MSKIILKNISKTYAGTTEPTVCDINLSILSGELIILLGESGCGKTTLLRLIAGLEEPDGGSIVIDDHDVTWLEPKKRKVAMVFQNYALYPHMTVYENMMYPLSALKLSANEKEELVAKNASMLKIHHCLKKKPGELSGGQRQRVAIGRALVRRPKVFLFDEPLSNLDARLRDELRFEISRLLDEIKITTIYVTHDQNEAMTLGDRIVLMRRGSISQSGTPVDIYTNPKNLFCAKFIGQPQINTIPVIFENRSFFQPDLKITLAPKETNLDYRSSVMCIRPEKIAIFPRSSEDGILARIEHCEFYGNRTHYLCRVNNLKIWVDSLRTDLITEKECRLTFSPEYCFIYDNKENRVILS